MNKVPVINQVSDLVGKTVFVRGDIDVPLSLRGASAASDAAIQDKIASSSSTPRNDMIITDDTRLKDIWATIEFLLSKNCQVILAGHLGRPEGKVVPELSSRPVAQYLANLTNSANLEDVDLGFIKGFKVSEKLTVLENLRFYPGEEANDPEFASRLAELADVYVNEAFAANGGEHASIVGVPKFLPHFAGLRLAKEIKVLSEVLENPKRPLVVIIGGAKLETKIPLIKKMAEIADCVIVGGKLLTQVIVGSDLMKDPKVKFLRLTENEKDVTLESIDRALAGEQASGLAGTIVWNGPVGQIEEYNYQVGTRRIAELVAASPAFKIVGGGDTVGFLDKLGLSSKFDWVCSGGGSMLKFLAGEKLPGVEALIN